MKIEVLTLFPEMFRQVLGESIIGRACEKGILNIELVNFRDFSGNKHNSVDDSPFGGGAGMVIQPEPVFNALREINAENKRIIYMSPKGAIFNQDKAFELSREDSLVILCGHYEGIDQRIIDFWNVEELSIGDYILTGGELPAMVVIDAVARMLPGVLGSGESHLEESICSGLLEYPHYSRPRVFEGIEVPEVLLSGNHRKISDWRFEQSLSVTYERRKDLFEKFLEHKDSLPKAQLKILNAFLEKIKE